MIATAKLASVRAGRADGIAGSDWHPADIGPPIEPGKILSDEVLVQVEYHGAHGGGRRITTDRLRQIGGRAQWVLFGRYVKAWRPLPAAA